MSGGKKRTLQSNIRKPQYDAAGNKINQYIPNYIASKPWYYSSESNTVDSNARYDIIQEAAKSTEVEDRLAHQRKDPKAEIVPNNLARRGEGIEDDFEVIEANETETSSKRKFEHSRKAPSGNNRLKFKKGACENCGSTKHKKRDCFEKPRKVTYMYRDDDVKDDKSKTKLENGNIYIKKDTEEWDVKRDRWYGYDSVSDYDKHLEEYKRKEEEAKLKLQKEREAASELDGLDEDELLEMQEMGLLDDVQNKIKRHQESKDDLPFNVVKPDEVKLSVRSLDEKPRYLEVIKSGKELNYNPKSRIYKDSSEGYYNDRGQFVRHLTGEAKEFEKLKKFARTHNETVKKEYLSKAEDDNTKKMTDLDYSSEVSPTALYLSMKEKEKQESLLRAAKKQELLDKYGGSANNDDKEVDEESAIPQGDTTYFEYTEKGEIKSKSEKDLDLINRMRSA